MGKKFFDMLRAQLIRMASTLKDNEAPDPVHIGLFRANECFRRIFPRT